MTNRNINEGIPSRCWCGKGIVTYVSKTEENPYRRFFRCEICLQVYGLSLLFNLIFHYFSFYYIEIQLLCVLKQRKKENHVFKWVDEALVDEIVRMTEHQARVDEEIEDLRISMKKTVQEEVMNHKTALNVGCLGTFFGLLCLWSKND